MHAAEPHHGLIIMQERARSLGGSLRVEDRDGGGTRLSVTIPANTARIPAHSQVEAPV